MDIEIIKKRLIGDIERLSDYRGFVKAGYPKFNVLFGRDSLIVSWQLLKYNPKVAVVTLKTLAALQAHKLDPERDAEPGKILHEMWYEEQINIEHLHIDHVPVPYYGSVDATPLFLCVMGKYWELTKDSAFIKKYWPNLVAAKDWIFNYGDANQDDFLDFERKNPYGPYNQSWKDGGESPQFGKRPIAAVEIQGYKHDALKYFNKLAEIAGNEQEKIKDDYLDGFQKKFLNEFFWQEEEFFYLAIDGEGKKYESAASNPGHLLFTELIGQEYKKLIVSRLFQEDLWTPYGIRTHSMKNPDFNPFSYQLGSVWPFDNWIIAEGLRVSGFHNEYILIKEALLKAYEELGHLPEFYAVTTDGAIEKVSEANPLQAWSSGALLNFLIMD